MKKLSYRLWSGRSFAKLFSLLACVALGSLFAQQAVAQDFEFGWEPFPPSSWDGGWDASLKCIAFDGSNGTTTLTRNLIPGTDKVTQEGTVSCKFTDPANNFQETATCSLSLTFDKLTHSCSADNTLTVIGTCPTQPVTVGTIDCGAAPGGANPTFCGYAGNDPSGNENGGCVWTLGYGKKIPPSNDVVGLGELCADVFPADQDLGLGLNEVFKFAQKYTGPVCSGEFASLGPSKARYFHSDTWDPTQLAFFNPSRPETRGTSSVQGQLIADTEYTGDTINGKCTPNNSGVITFSVLANPVERDQNQKPVAIEDIDQSTIEVNGRDIIPGSCRFDKFPNPNVMTCKVNRCVGGKSIIDETGIPGTNRATLEMRALMNDTPVVGDVETKKVVH